MAEIDYAPGDYVFLSTSYEVLINGIEVIYVPFTTLFKVCAINGEYAIVSNDKIFNGKEVSIKTNKLIKASDDIIYKYEMAYKMANYCAYMRMQNPKTINNAFARNFITIKS